MDFLSLFLKDPNVINTKESHVARLTGDMNVGLVDAAIADKHQSIIDKLTGVGSAEADTVQGYNQLKQDEGFSSKVYKDTKGIPTVGYGFNLNDPTMQKMIDPAIVTGKREMKQEEADKIFQKKYQTAYQDAIQYVGSDKFHKLDNARQDVLINMAYNLGINKLSGFKDLKKALLKDDFNQASAEMKDSNWHKQVKGRAVRLESKMKSGK